MENELKAKITADISDFEKKLNKAEQLQSRYEKRISNVQKVISQNTKASRDYASQIQRLNKEFQKGSISQKRYESEVKKLQDARLKANEEVRIAQRELTRLGREHKRVSSAIKNGSFAQRKYGDETKKAAGATKDLADGQKDYSDVTQVNAIPITNSFSRVLAGMPRGISGVSSSLTTLVGNLGNATRSAGGTKEAFRAVVATMSGPAGIAAGAGIAVGAITALIRSGVTLNDILSHLGIESAKFAKMQKEIADATADHAASSAVEIVELKALTQILQGTNFAYEDRVRAYNKLNEIHPTFLEGLSKEEAMTADLRDRTSEVNHALQQQARIKGAESVLTDVYAEIAKQQVKILTGGVEISDFIKSLFRVGSGFANPFSSVIDDISKLEGEAETLEGILTGLIIEDFINPYSSTSKEGISKAASRLKDELVNALKQQPLDIDFDIEITSEIDRNRVERFRDKLYDDLSDAMAEVDAIQALDIKTNVDIQNLEEANEAIKEISHNIVRLEKGLKDGVISSDLMKDMGDSINTASDDLRAYSEMLSRSSEMNELYSESGEELANSQLIFASAMQKGVATLGASLAKGESFLDSFKSAITSMIIDLISAALSGSLANAVLGGTSSGAATGPGAIVSIPAMIATLTASVLGAFASIPSFAQGGIIGGGSPVGDRVPIFANSGEMILNNRQQKNLFDLMNRSTATSPHSGQVEVVVRGEISGETIKLASDRYIRRRNRIG